MILIKNHSIFSMKSKTNNPKNIKNPNEMILFTYLLMITIACIYECILLSRER